MSKAVTNRAAATPMNVWDDSLYVKAYKFALTCGAFRIGDFAAAMGATASTAQKWLAEKPALARAIEEGKSKSKGKGLLAFMRLVSERIPNELKDIWEQLSSDSDDERDAALQKTEEGSRRYKQRLFIHAYIALNFDMPGACRATGLDIGKYKAWRHRDEKFRRVMDYLVTEAKGDFYENALLNLVAAGDTAATIFANRTYNKKRGYGNQLTLNVEGGVDHKHSIDLSKLSVETRMRMLEELRRPQIEDKTQVIDVEVIKEK